MLTIWQRSLYRDTARVGHMPSRSDTTCALLGRRGRTYPRQPEAAGEEAMRKVGFSRKVAEKEGIQFERVVGI